MNRPSFASAALSFLAAVCIVLSSTDAHAATAATPTFSPGGGTYNSTQSVTISDSTSGATIYYTTDGSTPTTGSTKYQGTAISVSVTTKVQAIATATGFTQSSVGSATYTIVPPGTSGTLQVFISPPGAQSTTVSGVATETFNEVTLTGNKYGSNTLASAIGNYAGNSTRIPIIAADQYGGANSSQYMYVGSRTTGDSTSVTLTLTSPVNYFGFWWSAGDQNNRVALYSGSTLYGTFSTADLLSFLNNGQGAITASNGTQYSAGSYFGNPNITSGSNDSTEPFAYVSFVITGNATINKIVFYNQSSSGFESDNHSVISSGGSVVIPSTYAPVETLTLGTQVVTPVLIPNYNIAPMTVGISTTTAGASINYTTDGSAPTTSHGTLYAGPITVAQTETVKAIGFETGLATSSVASATYTIPTLTVASSGTPSTYGNSVTFTATISSGPTGAITFYDSGTSIGTGTISGGSARLTTSTLAAGSHSITASWLGNSTYGSVLSSAITQTVNQAAPTISFTVPNQTYGVAPFTVSAISNSSGAITYSVVSGPATISGSTVTITGVGTVVLKASQAASGNYAAGTQTASFTVAAAGPTITFTVPNQTYGVAPFTVSATSNSSGAITYSVVSGPATISGSSVTITCVGTVVLKASQAASGNYAAGTQTASFTVAAAGPTITFTVPNQTYGVAPFTVSAISNSSGVITYSVVSGPATISGSTVTITGVGTVVLRASQAATTTYAASTASTNFSVVAVTPTVTVTSTTGTYGTPLTLTATSTYLNSGVATPTGQTPSYTLVSGPATLSSGVLTFTGTGSVVVTASVSATGNFGAATSAQTTIAVTAPQCTSSYQRTIVIDHTKVPNTDQANFPFLFNTTDPAFATIANGGHVSSPVGNDIIFSADPNGVTKLDHELEVYDPVHGQIIAWVRIPTLSHTTDTVLYVFYGNSGITASEQNPAGVWDSYYGGVWHLNQAGTGGVLSYPDSTANANNGTVNGSPVSISGEIGGALDFAGYGDNFAIRSIPLNSAAYTVSAWFNTPLPTTGSWNTLTRGASGDHQVIVSEANWHLGSFGNAAGGFFDSGFAVNSLSNGWHHLAAAATGNITTFYVDGAQVGTIPFQSSADIAFLGNYQGGGQQFGEADEIRISTGLARSADWIAAEYSNESSPTTFYTLSSEDLDNTEQVNPGAVTLYAAQNQQFAMLGVGTCSSVAVNWAINPSVGTISATGLYSAPAAISAQQTVTVTATNQGNSTYAFVTLMPSSSGPAGTVVTINGVGFGTAEGASTVTVGGLPAVTLFWSNTQIQAQIPTGTGIGNQDVVVTVGGQTITNTMFNVTAGLTGITPSAAGTPASVTIDAPGQQAPLVFSGTAGQYVFVQISNSTFPNEYFGETVNVTILNPNGSILYSGVIGVGSGLINSVALPTTGLYTFVLAPISVGTGSADMVMWEFSEQTGTTLTPSVPALVNINTPGQDAQLTFNGNAGQFVSVQISNSTFPNEYFGETVNVTILNPNGSILYSGVTGVGSGFINSVALPTTGTYNLVFAPINGGTGSANITIWVFNELTGTITPTIPYNIAINIPGQAALLTFSGVASQIASVQISNSTFPNEYFGETTNISILNPGGSILYSGVIGVGSGSISPVTLPATGTYTLVFAPMDGGIGSATALLTLTYPNVTMSANLVPIESWLNYPVVANVTLMAKGGAAPTGTVSCSGAGVTSAPVTVNANGSAAVQINGLPLGKDAIVCSFTSSNLLSFANAASSPMIESVIASPGTGAVSVTPASLTLYAGQTHQFSASVFNTSNQAVSWSVSPSGAGTISATGLFTAPATVTGQQTIAITATSQANPAQSASAMITLSPPQCASSGYSYQRAIVIDHTKIPNTDQTDFPFLFSATDPVFKATGSGGHVSNSSGYDIIFSTDPGGVTKLDHELEQYNPATGQVTAWVRIPTLSHTTDTVLYVFYGNASITTSQQNPTGVWDSNNSAVYHLANVGTGVATDSTANNNNGTLTSVSAAPGEIYGGASLNGASSYLQIPSADFPSYPTSGSTTTGFSASFGIWFQTASAGVILGQTDGTEPGGNPSRWQPALYVDTAGLLRASLFSHGGVADQIVTATAYNDNNWHFAVDTYTNGTEELYVDGQLTGSQQVAEAGYNSAYAYFVGTGETANWPAANGSWLYLNGALDEVTVSTIARSADWVQSEYSNQSSPSTFYALYPENTPEVIPAAVSLSASQSQQFTVLGSAAGSCSSPAVIWSMPAGLPGMLTATGLYTAPNSIDTPQTVTVTGTTLGDSTRSISTTVTLMPAITVSVTPGSVILTGGQTQAFTASVNNTSNTGVTWTINPAGAGSISSTGLYTAPASEASQLMVNVTATSQADPTQSASVTITLSPTSITPIPPSSPQCGSSGYSYQRTIVIDHMKVPNTDQTNFPFLFNTIDTSLATIANGGQVTSPNGYDILFSTDPNGLTKLDYELEEYDPVHGQVSAWVRIPTLSHTTDTVLYVFYGNPNIISSQQNPAGAWDSNYLGVYHLANTGMGAAADSTTYANNGTLTAISPASGEIDGAASLNGVSSYIQIPEADFPNYPTGVYDNLGINPTNQTTSFSASFGVWFKTASAGGILGQQPDPDCIALGGCIQNYNPQPSDGDEQPGFGSMLYVDDNGSLRGGGVATATAYNDSNWHFAVVTYATDGTDTLYVDGQNVGSAQQQFPTGYAPNYRYYVGTTYTYLAPEGNWNWLYFNGNIDEVSISNTPRSGDWVQTEYNNQSSPSTFYTFNPASSVQVSPTAISLYASQSQQFAAADTCASTVTWTMPSGAQGLLTATGLYTAPASITTQQAITVTATNQATNTTIGSSIVTLLPPPQPITLAAATQPPYTVGSSQGFAATLMNQDGTPQIGVAVTFTVTGANSNIGSGTTNSNGVASYTYTGASSGNDTIQATAVVDDQLSTSNSTAASWIVSPPPNPEGSVTLMAPPTLGQGALVGAFTDNTGAVIEPIAIGVATRTFVVPTGATQLQLGVDDDHYADNGGSGFIAAINGVPLTVPVLPTAMPWNWVTGGLNNNYQYGMNDGTSPVVAATGLTQGESISIAYQSGTISTNYPLSPLVNADGDQTFITGVTIWQGTYFPTLYTTGSSYPEGQPITFNALVTNSSGTAMPNVPVTLTVTGANAQQLQVTTDSTGTATFLYSGANAGTDNLQAQALPSGEGSLSSGQAAITWTSYPAPPTVGKLTLNYISCVNNVQGYYVLATNASNNPVANANIGFYVSGADNLSQGATTDITGQAAFMYYHVNTGMYNLVAVDSVGRNVIVTTPTISGQWAGPCIPSNDTITAGVSALTTVALPNTLSLAGIVTDSANLTPQVAWSQAGGPGTVTFTTPTQTITGSSPLTLQSLTTATFSQIGTYEIELSASDASNNSGSSGPFTVTVVPAQQNPQGWIASPAYGSGVSGVVPITLAPGVTIQPGGTLTYYPANNPGNTTTLPITAQSGTIATLDTTTLVNGTYWIQLQATNTSGQMEYSLVLVTVTGNYKPGRVTATVTDLVVPATGLAINIQRNYDSLNAATSSDFGYGWSLGINVNLTVDPAGDVTFTLGGQRKTFYFTPRVPPCTAVGCLVPYYFPAYTPEPGLHGTLTDSGLGCPSLDILVPIGSQWACQSGGLYAPPGYIYTDPNGTAYTISAAGNLQSIQDLSGNGLTITPSGITSTSGLSVPFVRDSGNRITQITDTAGNIYQYGYDANGNLASVTYPSTSPNNPTCAGATAPNTSTYTYDSIHLYTGGTDALCHVLPTSTYYPGGETDPNGNSLSGRLQSATDALGNTTRYAYTLSTTSTINGVSVPNTDVTTITYPDNGTATMIYDSYGDLLQSEDPNKLITVNTYDANHNLISVTDPLGHTNRYTYNANGNKTSSTYPATSTSTNTTSTTAYNQYSEATSTTDELGNVRIVNYNANYLPTSISDSLGTLTSFVFNPDSTLASGAIGFDIGANPAQANQFTYDANGNMASRTDALGRTTFYVYNSLGQKLSMTAPTPTSPTGSAASTTTYQYDAMGNLIQTVAPLSRTTSSTYDANGNKLSDTDARGNTTSYKYDALNRLVETDYPDQTKSTKSYDFRNNVIDEIDLAGNDTRHVYDPAGRQISVTRGYGSATTTPSTTSYTYYNDGRRYTETDPANNVTTYYYDAAGRLTSVSGAQGSTTFTYDDAGNRISQTDGKGNTTSFQYNARKRLIETDYPDHTSVKNSYDGPGNLIQTIDQAQNTVQYTYDAANQLKTVVQVNSPNAPANTTQYSYNPLGNLTGLTDERGNTTQNLFDQDGEPIQKTLPAAQTETRTYDAAGNLSSLVHFNGVTTTYTYDALNRLLSRATPGETTVSFTYTATGKYLTSTAQDGTVNYTYDALDRLITKATPEGTLSYTYYPTGRVETITSSNPRGVSATYTYDDQNRLSTVVDNRLSGQNTTTYSYDSASNVVTAAYPNSLTSTFTYDALNRLTALSTPASSYSYTLGPAGNRTNATEGNGRTLQWNYDGIYRLNGETIIGDPANNGDNNGNATYTLDPVGNRTAATSTLSGIDPIAGSYNPNDQLSSETYDANGNTTQTANGNSYTYDSENHMIKMTNGSAVVTMIYDAFGNRVAKTGNGITTQYLVEDDVNPTGYPQVVEELTGPTGSGVVTRQYTYGLQRISENQLIQGAWTPSFYGYDGFGSVRQLTNSAGVVTDSYEYDAFGNSFTKSGTTPNNYLYRGEQYDSDLALYYLRARYYNPATGRFMSRDPEDGKAKVPATLHKYLYAGGDPVNAKDPTGRAILFGEGAIYENFVLEKVPGLIQIGCAVEFFLYLDVELANYFFDKATGAGMYNPLPEPPSLICAGIAFAPNVNAIQEGLQMLFQGVVELE